MSRITFLSIWLSEFFGKAELMGARGWASHHTKAVSWIAVACVVLCFGVIVVEVAGHRRPPIGKMPDHYFTIDDGKSFFPASGANVPPFDYKGHVAVRAHVFEVDGKRFVGYLEKYTPEVRKLVIARTVSPLQEIQGRELKKTGDANWISGKNHAAIGKLMNQIAPPGASTSPIPVEP